MSRNVQLPWQHILEKIVTVSSAGHFSKISSKTFKFCNKSNMKYANFLKYKLSLHIGMMKINFIYHSKHDTRESFLFCCKTIIALYFDISTNFNLIYSKTSDEGHLHASLSLYDRYKYCKGIIQRIT